MKTIEKLLAPSINHNIEVSHMTNKEKIEYIKKKYGLVHGKGKRKKNKK